MKQDYLWDKTGSDPEIERLEELLSGFRYKEEPASVANVLRFPAKTKGSRQPWIFAMAACVALAAVSIGIWNVSEISSMPESLTAVQMPEERMPVVNAEIVTPESTGSKPEHFLIVKKQKSITKRKYAAQTAKKRGPGVEPVLTKEEKYAYGQLMLALAISSSKLQMVQDSINGIEQNDTVNDK